MKHHVFIKTLFGVMLLISLWAELSATGLAAVAVNNKTITITDMANRTISVVHNPERIVCIGPGALRLIVYLQAQEKVVGVEDMEKLNPGGRPYWIANRHLQELPRIGPGGLASINKKPDMEALLRVRPDVIFITYMDASLADEVQKTINIPVVVLSYGAFATFDEQVYEALRITGKVLHRQQRAAAVVAFIEERRNDLHQRTVDIAKEAKPRVYVGGIGYRGAQGIESTETDYAPLQWNNGVNLARQVVSPSGSNAVIDKETLLGLNPDVIFIDGGGLSLVMEDYHKKREYYRALQAFQNHRIYILHPFNFYTTNIGTALTDGYAIGKILYPEKFLDVDPEEEANEIYTFLVGKAVYEDLKERYGALGRFAPFLQ